MRASQSLRIGVTILGLNSLLYMSACGAKKQVNEGFPQSITELNKVDYEDGFWKSLREALQVPVIEGNSIDDLIAGLFVLPSYLTDEVAAPAAVTQQTATLLATAESSVCAEIKVPLVDLNPGAAIGSVDAFSVVNGTPTSLEPLGAKVYLMNYKLKGDTEYRQSIVTVPKTAPATAHGVSALLGVQSVTAGAYGYPLLMYGHAGASGLAYTEIAASLGDLQRGHIIAAPVFPGEPVCKTYDTGTATCTGDNVLSAAVGVSLPYENDVIDYLGLHDCMKTFASDAPKAFVNPITGAAGLENLSTKIVKINAQAESALASVSELASAAAGAPVAIASGLGRGAAVAGLALARAGAYNSVFGSTDTEAITALAGKGVRPPMFSCSLLASPQASIISGSNRLLLESWVRGGSDILGPADRAAAEAIPGFAAIHAKIQGIRNDANLADADKVSAIKAYVEKIDLVSSAALMQVGVQNFGKIYSAQLLANSSPGSAAATKSAAQGAVLLMHGTQDQVANIGNSVLLSNYGVGTSESLIAAELTAGTNWLALGIKPPVGSVNELGNLPITDLHHVDSPNFINGLSSDTGDLISNIDTSEFVDLTPPTLIATWSQSVCNPAINSDPEPEPSVD